MGRRWILIMMLALTAAMGAWVFGFSQVGQAVFFPIYSIGFSPKGDFLVTGGGVLARPHLSETAGLGELRVWETQKWKQTLHVREGFSDPVLSVFFKSDSLLSCASSKLIRNARGNPSDGILVRSWDLSNFSETENVKIGRYPQMRAASFSRKDNQLAIAALGVVYDFNSKSVAFVLEKEHATWDCVFSPDGAYLLSCARERPGLRLYDGLSGKSLVQEDLHESLFSCARFSPDGKYVIALGRGELKKGTIVEPMGGTRIVVLDSKLKKELANIAAPVPYYSGARLAIAPDGQTFAVQGAAGSVVLFELKTGKLLRSFSGHVEGVNCLAFSPDGQLLAVGCGAYQGGAGVVRVWDLKNGLVAQLR